VSARPLVIGSRGSRLALWQANFVQGRLAAAGRPARILEIRTSGDRFTAQSLAAIGGQGLFVKEIEEALAAGTIDLAVHSLKDLPTQQPAGLVIACVPEREDPRDMLLARGAGTLGDLPRGASVGTGSPRRACQIRALRPDLVVRDLRGNVETRIARFERGDFDAIILAAAGIRRLGLSVEGAPLAVEEMLPAVGQGALAIETRGDDAETRSLLGALHHDATARAVTAERALLRGLGGGCQAPIAAHGVVADGRLVLHGLVADPEGRTVLRHQVGGDPADPEGVGNELAEAFLARGAAALLGLPGNGS
jgi:hydroxymethylbilane synthase